MRVSEKRAGGNSVGGDEVDITSFLSPMVGSFFGVCVGFIINYRYQKHIRDKTKTNYINMIKNELSTCSILLSEDGVMTLPSNNWASIVNSGGLSLFDKEEELLSLNFIYQAISDYNYISKDNTYTPWDYISEKYKDKAHPPEGRLVYIRKCLQEEIEKLVKEEWMNPTQATITIKADETGAYFETKSKYWFWR